MLLTNQVTLGGVLVSAGGVILISSCYERENGKMDVNHCTKLAQGSYWCMNTALTSDCDGGGHSCFLL